MQRLNATGSVYLTGPSRLHFIRAGDEFTWRTNQLFDAIATGTVGSRESKFRPHRHRGGHLGDCDRCGGVVLGGAALRSRRPRNKVNGDARASPETLWRTF